MTQERERFGVDPICKVLQVAPRTIRAHLARPVVNANLMMLFWHRKLLRVSMRITVVMGIARSVPRSLARMSRSARIVADV